MSLTEASTLCITADLLQSLKYRHPNEDAKDVARNAALSRAANARLDSFGFGAAAEPWRIRLETAVGVVTNFYPYHSFDLQLLLAVMIGGHFWIDDHHTSELEGLGMFAACLTGRRDGVPRIYQRLADEHLNLYDYYDPVTASQMIASISNAAAGTHVELRASETNAALSRDAEAYPYFLRLVAGFSAFYTLALYPKAMGVELIEYVQAVPYMMQFMLLGNDVLSAYKELDEREENFVRATSKVSNRTPTRVLQESGARTVDAHERVKRILAGKPEALEVWQTFVPGYVAFHLRLKRYRLPLDLLEKLSAASEGTAGKVIGRKGWAGSKASWNAHAPFAGAWKAWQAWRAVLLQVLG